MKTMGSAGTLSRARPARFEPITKSAAKRWSLSLATAAREASLTACCPDLDDLHLAFAVALFAQALPQSARDLGKPRLLIGPEQSHARALRPDGQGK
jgi:hypothetical protein